MSIRRARGLLRVLRRAGRPVVRPIRRFQRRQDVRHAAKVIRAARGARVVLLYHRVLPREVRWLEVVPTVPVDLFRQHMTALGELACAVSLGSLVNDRIDGDAPLQFALTFDDDYEAHVQHVLPVLRTFSLRGTFFLSGRALHGLGGYWFERLEALVVERGVSETANLLGLPGTSQGWELTLRCEGDLRRQAVIERNAPPVNSQLDAVGIRALVDAGMTVGFHTLRHPVLPQLSGDAQREALVDGRDRLAAVVGVPLDWLAYPHGKANATTIELTREAGYTAAWTTECRLMQHDDDSHQRGRVEPHHLPVDDLLIRLASCLQSH